jgi:aspartyl-tRNA(Asn)/glutamyl-tRNA(Gln) amidotransferase subunit B
MSGSWEVVIGLEVHVQLATRSKFFSGSSTHFGAEPNTQANVVDLGFPGVLPVANAQAIRMAIAFGLAIDAQIAPVSVFARKNYFYPDLPKGYQISQFEQPIVGAGSLPVQLPDGNSITVPITRAHLEEDAGKSVHDAFHGATGLDLNRAGVPLIEVVSEPALRSSTEAVAFLRTLHTLVRFLGICDGNMAEGSFRCDANVSVRRPGAPLGTRCEIKNVNSFRFVEKAIDYEAERQIRLLEGGGTVIQQTRLYDAARNETRAMRSKEDADDYRYFPCPDLPPLHIAPELIAEVRAGLPELPAGKRERYATQWGLSADDAAILSSDKAQADYLEALVAELGDAHARTCANWIQGELKAALNNAGLEFEASPVDAAQLAGIIRRVSDGTLSNKMGKQVFEALWTGKASTADAAIELLGLRQISDSSALVAIVDQVIAAFPKQVLDYQNGNDKLLQFLVGQAMKASRGQANPGQLNALLMARLFPNK